MISAAAVARPGWFARLWMWLSPSYDERAQDARAKRQETVRQDAISARVRVEQFVGARNAAALRGYRAEGAALRRRHP